MTVFMIFSLDHHCCVSCLWCTLRRFFSVSCFWSSLNFGDCKFIIFIKCANLGAIIFSNVFFYFSFFSFKGSNYTYMKLNEIVLQLLKAQFFKYYFFLCVFHFVLFCFVFCCLQIHLSFLLQCLILQ